MMAPLRRSLCALTAPAMRMQLLLLLVLASATLTGCGGCRPLTPAQRAAQEEKQREQRERDEAKRREEEKKNQPFQIGKLTPLLSESIVAADGGQSLPLVKPGHWTATVQPMKANLGDFEGRLTVAAVDDRRRPLPLPKTPYRMISSRPAVLAKGRAKRVENEFLVPLGGQKLEVMSELVGAASGSTEQSSLSPWTVMPPYQYFILVLAREPSRYAYLKVTDAVQWPFEDDNGQGPPHYRVVLADGDKPLPLPPNALTWTSVAYVIWDEANLDRIDPEQQAAVVDWLHWGGRLIINGPDSLDGLRGSFLAAYLPAEPGERITIDASKVEAFSQYWSQRRDGEARKPLAVTKPWSGIELKPRESAHPLPAAEGLFYERGVGAGSVVASAVQLAERDLINWPGFDGFLNGGLLRRPAREFAAEQEGWTGLQTKWIDAPARARDAYFTTPLRWFARDAFTRANVREVPVEGDVQNPRWYGGGYAVAPTETVADRPGGLGQWNEFGPASQAARTALAEAAGVRVPAAGFVVACLAVYLTVLVPLNWMVFHALGRLEWAWICAPLIALAGTVVVVRQAQLDIGFVRSQTEIALLELYGDYPRGHLSRYTAIYSSLSSSYDLEFDGNTAVATPFPVTEEEDPRSAGLLDSLTTVAFEKNEKPRLRGMEVASASTQMVHSEQMAELAGPIRLFPAGTNQSLLQLKNECGYDLSDAVVIHRRASRDGKDRLRGCWLGLVRKGASVMLRWSDVSLPGKGLPYAEERRRAAQTDYHARLNVDPLLRLAFRFPDADDPLHGMRDEYRLIARIDDWLPGAAASPTASQHAGATVVLGRLRLADAPFPEVDANSPSDVTDDKSRNAYDEELEAASSP